MDEHDDGRHIFDVETDFARQFDLQSFVSDGKTDHLRQVCNTGARCVREKKLYNTTRGRTHLLPFF